MTGTKTATSHELNRQSSGMRRLAFPVFTVLVLGFVTFFGVAWYRGLPDDAVATYVGRATCAECHAAETRDHHGSYHDLAMAPATEESVLGDFSDAELTHHGVTSRMFRRGGSFWIHTEGPDGKLADFEIKYVFGVAPLQQYLVEFDRGSDYGEKEVGRLQVLRISWDTEKKEWFYLPPPDVPEKLEPDDPLHWTGIAQRWNTMCADCHSTNFEKGFDVKTLRYRSTFSEIDVSCETCHGPGSLHVKLAKSSMPFWDRKRGKAISGFKTASAQQQVETCAPCHSRRSVVEPHFRPENGYYNHYMNELLEPATYFADGQILDEVYVYGSFIQSKMFHKGVKCTDCHDPHTTKLKYSGNKVCTSCHQHPAGKYDTEAHHHHQPGTPGSRCVECHIPETTYMEVDPRRDHSFRVPRPDLSVKLGLPNACTRCHLDRAMLPEAKKDGHKQYRDWVVSALQGDQEITAALKPVDQWCADAFQKWYPDWKPPRDFADVMARAREGDESVLPDLVAAIRRREFAAIVRASLMQAAVPLVGPVDPYRPLPAGPVRDLFQVAASWLQQSDAQLQVAAIRAYELRIPLVGSRRIEPQAAAAMAAQLRRVVRELMPVLDDERRAVRVEAARVLQRLPPALRPDLLDTPQRERLAEVTQELMAQYDANADRSGAHLAKALVYEAMGRDEDAIAAYETAIRVEPTTPGPRSNLATLLDRLADGEQSEAMQLAQARRRDAAIGRLARADEYRRRAAQLRAEELPLLARDAKLAPENAAVQYRYGLNLYLTGDPEAAEKQLRRAVELAPDNPEFLLTLAAFYREFGKPGEALKLVQRLLELEPDNPTYLKMRAEIQQQLSADPAGRPPANPPDDPPRTPANPDRLP